MTVTSRFSFGVQRYMLSIALVMNLASVIFNVRTVVESLRVNRALKAQTTAMEVQTRTMEEYLATLKGSGKHYAIMHVPASGKCPPGYDTDPKAFELDGKPVPGCRRRGGASEGTIDVLNPGERVRIEVFPEWMTESGRHD